MKIENTDSGGYASEFTFYRPNCAASHLDRFYVPQHLVPHVKDVQHHASLADHHYAVADFELPDLANFPSPPRSGQLYWKLNASILQDEDFLHNFSDLFQKLKAKISDFDDIGLVGPVGKAHF